MSGLTFAGCRIVEMALPAPVQLALVGDREAAIKLKDGQTIILQRDRFGSWNRKP